MLFITSFPKLPNDLPFWSAVALWTSNAMANKLGQAIDELSVHYY